jgi:hypothetical protein
MQNYAAGLMSDRRPRTDAETQARKIVWDNEISSVSTTFWRLLMNRDMIFLRAMRDGLVVVTDRYSRFLPTPVSTRTVASYDWSQIASIDLRTNPVSIVIDGTVLSVGGISDDMRRIFFNHLTEAQLAGTMPARPVLAGHGGEAAKDEKKTSWVTNLVGGFFIIAVLVGIAENYGGSAAICKMGALEVKSDVFIVNGEADAGWTITATISNSGKQGPVRIKARLETSEGQFVREQDFTMPENATRNLSFGFPEPTINASNVQGAVSCSPP